VAESTSDDNNLKDSDGIKVQHTPSGQSASEELLAQDQGGGKSNSLQANVGHENMQVADSENVGVGNINPVYMQPNYEGKFELTKKEFLTTIQDDKIIERSLLEEQRSDDTKHVGTEEFSKLNIPQNLANLPGSELGFTKVYSTPDKISNNAPAAKVSLDEINTNHATSNQAAPIVVQAAPAVETEAPAPESTPEPIPPPKESPDEKFELPQPPTIPPYVPPVTILIPTSTPTPTDENTTNSVAINARSDIISGFENKSVTFTAAQLLVNDTLGTNGGALKQVELNSAHHGALVDNHDGTYTYTPEANFYGADSFKYQLVDASGNTVTANVAVNIAQVNDLGPVAPGLSYSIDQNNTVLITAQDLLAQASDADNFGNTNLGLSVSNVAYNGNMGTLRDNGNGTWIFTPAFNFTGALNLSFNVTDGVHTTQSNIDVTVNPVVTESSVTPISFTMNEESTILITSQELLSHAINPGNIGELLFVANVSYSGVNGTLHDNNDGTWTFTGAKDFFGAVQLNFDVTNGSLVTSQHINVIVLPVDDAPVAAPVAYSAIENNSILITASDLLAQVTDVDDPLSNLSITNVLYTGANGSLYNNGDGTWTFTPTKDFTGNLQIEFTVTDGTLFTPAHIDVNITPSDIAPDVTPVSYTMNEDGTLLITAQDLLAHASDIDNTHDQLSITNVSYTGNLGLLHDNGDGTWNFIPAQNFNGDLQLNFGVTDGILTTQQNIAVTVLPFDLAPVVTPIDYSINQNNRLLITEYDLLNHAYDLDTPFNQLSVNNVEYNGSNGTLQDNGNHTWTFIPNTGFNGAVQLSFSVTDGQLSTPQNINVTVNPLNTSAPDTPMTYVINEDNGLLIKTSTLQAHLGDTLGEIAISNVVYIGNNGTLTDNNNGTWTFIPNQDFNGHIDFTYSATDGGLTTSHEIGLTIKPVDDAPAVPVFNFTIVEDNTLLIRASDLLLYSTDVDNTAEQLSVTNLIYNGQNGSIQNNGDGTWTFIPAENFTGSLQLNFTVSDGTLFTPSTINVNVTPIDQAPDVTQISYAIDENQNILISAQDLLAHATDVDTPFEQLSITNVSYDGFNGSLHDNGNGTWTFTPAADFNGDLKLQFEVSDGQLSTSQNINITVIPVNQAPIATPVNYTINENNALIISKQDLLAHAADIDTPFAQLNITNVQYNGAHGTLVDNNYGTWTFNPETNFNGNLQLSFDVSDGQLSTNQNIAVTVLPVNQAPDVTSLNYTINEEGNIIIRASDLLANATDVDTTSDQLSVVNLTYSGTNGSLYSNGDGTWTFTGNKDFFGNVKLDFAISDGSLFTPQKVNITVNPINDAPVVTPVSYTINEDNSLLIRASDLIAHATDVDNIAAELSVTNVAYLGNNGTLTDNNNGTWTFKPNLNFNGAVQLSFAISDGQLTTPQNISVTVNPVNDAPITSPISLATTENSPIIITAAQLLGSSYDVDSSTITPINVTSTHGTIVDNGNSTWTYTPENFYSGIASLRFDVTDGQLSTPSSGIINIASVNNSLSVTPAVFTTNEDNSFVITKESLLTHANDSLFSSNDLSITNVQYVGTHGSLIDNHNDTWTFIPTADYNGSEQLEFSVSNGRSVIGQSINMIINPVNDAPVATPISYSIYDDNTLLITASDLLAHASDIDNTLAQLSIANVAYSGSDGTLTDNHNGTWTFTPAANFVGPVQLNFSVSDGQLTTAQNINVTVNHANIAPVVPEINYTINEDNSLLIRASDLLANVTDVDNTAEQLSVTNVSYNGNQGTLVDNNNGTWTFTPSQDFYGPLQLSFAVTDGILTTPQDINVNVNHVNIAPVVTPLAYTINENNTLLIRASDLLARATDVDNTASELSVTNVTYTGGNGSLHDNGNGTWTFTPALNFYGGLQLSFGITDGQLTTSQYISVNINNVNAAPTVTPVDFTINEDSSLLIKASDLLAHVTDIDTPAAGLNITNVMYTGNNGSLHNNGNGTWTFTPGLHFNGDVQLAFNVSDGQLYTPSNIRVHVLPVDNAPVVTPVSYTINEDNSILIRASDLLTHASDIDNTAAELSVTNVSYTGSHGTLIDNHNGTWTFTPNQYFNGTVALNFAVTDGILITSQHIDVNVLPVENAPTATDLSFNMLENDTIIIQTADLLAHANDVDGDRLTVTNITSSQGVLVNNHDGSWSFTPAHNFSGNLDLVATISDGTLTTNQLLHIAVAEIDVAPVVPEVSLSVLEDNTLTIRESDLLAHATDVNNDILSISNITAPQGTLVNNHNGTWSFTPAPDFNGNLNLLFTVNDGTFNVDQTLHVNVLPVNDAPVAVDLNMNMLEDGTLIIRVADLLAQASDVDGDLLTITNISAPQGTLVNNHNGTWSFAPNSNFNGNVNLSFTVSDGSASTIQQIHVNVVPVDDAPVVTPVNYTVSEDHSVIITASDLLAHASDIDNTVDQLSVANVAYNGANGTLIDNNNGTWTFTPNHDFNGAVQLSFSISDGQLSTPQNININITPVNDAPVVTPVAYNLNEDNSLLIRASDLLTHASDVDNTAAQLHVTNVVYTGADGILHDNGDGTWTFTPTQDFNGHVQLSFAVTDGQLTTPQNIDVNVHPINNAPVVTPVSYSIQEDHSLIIRASDLLAHASDVDNTADQLHITNVAYTGANGALSDNGDGTWTFTPNHDFNGSVELSFAVTDGIDTVPQNINVTISPVNDAPVAAPVALTATEDTSITYTTAQLLGSSYDIDSTSLSVNNVVATHGAIIDNHDGTWTYIPDANYNGPAVLNFNVSDGQLNSPSSAAINIAPVNDTPVAAPVSYSIQEDHSLIIRASDLLAHASDVDNTADQLYVTNVAYTGANGVLSDNGDGTWTFTPNHDFNGSVELSFAVTDGIATVPQNINVTISPVNDAPVAVPVTLTATEDTSITYTTAQLLGSSYDIDNTSLSVNNVVATHGAIIDNHDGTWTYIPDADYNGAAVLNFNISDGQLNTPSSAAINIAPVNDAPVAVPVTLTATEDTSITYTTAQLLGSSYDIDSTSLSVNNVVATHGAIIDNHDGTWTYIPDANYNGPAVLNFNVSDGQLNTPSSAAINIGSVNDAPDVTPVNYFIGEDHTLLIRASDLLDHAYDVDHTNAQLQVTDVTYSGHDGILQDNGDNSWTFIPNPDFNGAVQLDFAISDGSLTTPQQIFIDVTPVDDAPIVSSVSYTIEEDHSLLIRESDLLAHATDIDNAANQLYVTNVSYSGINGSIHDNGNGTWTFTPNHDFNGSIQLNFGVSDGELVTPQNIAVNITPVNDAPVAAPVTICLNEDIPIIITNADLLGTSYDVDSTNLIATNVTATHGTIVDNHNGTWTYTPDHNYNGDADLSFNIFDGQVSTPSSAALEIAPVNDAPVVTPVNYYVAEDHSVLIRTSDLLAHASDIDNTADQLYVSNVVYTGANGTLIDNGNGTLIDNGNGTWTFTPTENFNGNIQLNFAVSDGQLATSQNINVHVTSVDNPPVVAPVNYAIDEDNSLIIRASDLLANVTDADNTPDQLHITNVAYDGNKGLLHDNGDGTWTFTPNHDFNGAVELRFDVFDGSLVTTQNINVQINPVNDAPVTQPVILSAIEDTAIIITNAQLLGASTDVEGDVLTATDVTATHGTIINNHNGTWTYTPDLNYNGAAQLSFNVSDGQLSTPSSAVINIAAVNDAPVAAPVVLSAVEDTPIVFTTAQLLGNSYDVDGDALSVNTVSVNHGNIINNGNGTWTFIPDPNFNGAASLSFSINDGIANVATSTIINVVPVNDAPVVSARVFSVLEDNSILITKAQLLVGASDVDGDVLSVTNVALAAGAQGVLIDNNNGTWTFTPNHDFNGQVSLSFNVSDGTALVANSASINVIPVNDAPVAAPVALAATEDTAITFTTAQLLGASYDVDQDSLSVNAVSVNHGHITNNNNGTWTFVPDANFNGPVDLSFNINDGTVNVASSGVINVAAVNDAPVVSPRAFSVLEDNSILITNAQLVAGATDVDGDALIARDVALAAGAQGVLIDNNNGTWTFTPNHDFNGQVALSFNVSDGTALVANSASINVIPVNDAPVAAPVALAATEDTAITFTTAQLLGASYDVDQDSLSVNAVSVNHGHITNNNNGTWTFVPDANFNGPVALSFNINDGTVNVASSGVINVAAVNDAPVVSPRAFSVLEDNSILITNAQLVAGATDVDGDALIARDVALAAGAQGVLIDNNNGTWTFTPNHDFNGQVALSFNVSDGTALVANSASINVIPVNDAPVAAPVTLNAVEDTSVIFTNAQLLGASYDVDHDVLMANTVSAEHGSIVNNGDGTWTYTPDANYNGPAAVSFSIFDGTVEVPSSAIINVAAVNDAPIAVPVLLSAVEDTSVTFSAAQLLGSGSDVDHDTLTVNSVTVEHGQIIDNHNGTWTYIPDPNFNGNAGLSFNINDGTLNVHSSGVINVAAVNDAPVVVPQEFTIGEEQSIIITNAQLVAGATDVDGDMLIATEVCLEHSSHGILINNNDGTWTFTPNANFNGDLDLHFKVYDGTVAVDNHAVIHVNSTNDAPIAIPVVLAATEDTAIVFTTADLLGDSYDVDSASMSIVNISATHGSIVDNHNGTFTYTPDANYNGAANLSFSISDGQLTSVSSALINIAPVNDAPVAAPVTLATVEDTSITFSTADLLGASYDIDSSSLSIINISATHGIIVDNGDGTFTYTPDANYNGAAALSFDVFDGELASHSSAAINIAAVNDAPVAAPVILAAIEDTAVTFSTSDLLGSSYDIDSATLSIVNISATHGTIVANANGTFTYTPDANYNGAADFSFDISDGQLTAHSSAAINIAAVNDAPVAVPVTLAATEDTSITFTAAQLLGTSYDIDSANLSIVNISATHGSIVANANGTFTYTPDANYNGPAALSFGISDGQATTASSAAINIAAVNDAPVAVPVVLAATEDTSITFTAAQLLGTSYDIDSANLSIVNISATHGSIVANANGTFTYTPDANYNGPAALSFGISDGQATTASSAAINIAAVNDAPVAVPVTLAATEDTSITFTAAQLLGTSYDIDSATLSIVNISATHGSIVANANGTFTYTPDANYNGPAALSFGISDGQATTASSAAINIAAVNDAPVAVPVTLAATEDTAIIFTKAQLLGTSYDIDSTTLSIVNISATHGTIVANANGTFTYTPDANYNGPAALSFGISDGQATTASSAAINIAAVNDAPVAVPVTLAATEDTSITFTTAQLLGTSYDIDSTTLSIVNISATHGTIVANANGTFTYTPDANYNGPAALSFGISDGQATTASSAAINIAAVNDAPVAVPVTLAATEDTSITFTTAQLLGTSYDIDSTTLSIVNISATHGTIVANANGTFTYTPDANYNGPAALSFGISDGQATTASSAAINIAAVNDAPVAVPVVLAATEDTSITFTAAQLLGTSYDIDSATLSIVNISATHGTIVANANGTFTYTPDANYNGPAALSFGISDGQATTASSAAINIAAVNDAPVAVPVTLAATEDTAIIFTKAQLLGSSYDIDSPTLSIVGLSAAHGTIVDNNNGTYTFIPDPNYSGTATISFSISDGSLSTPSSATINIAAVNDAPVVTQVYMSMNEDTTLVINESSLLSHATDADGNALSITNITAAQGTIVNNHNGTWSFTPAHDFSGALSLTFSVSDGTATTNQALNIRVRDVNDAPVVPTVAMSMQEDGSLIIHKSDLLASAYDVDGDLLSVSSVTCTQGTIRYTGNDTWTFAPAANFNGNLNLQFTVSDGHTSVVQTLAVSVAAVNDAPVVSPRSFSMNEDGAPIVITNAQLIAGSSDVDSATLTATNVALAAGSQGSLVNNNNGTWTFTPAANFNGNLTLNYNVSDGLASKANTATISVATVNDAPVVGAIANFNTVEDTGILISKAALLANTTDIDSSNLTISAISVPAAQGTILANSNGSWTFAPAANFNGTATISYTVSDGTATTSSTANVIVAAVNDLPVVNAPNAFSMNEDGTLSITQASLLAGATDADGNALTVTSVSVPAAEGTISGNSGGPWIFTPAANFNGAATLTFTTSDGTGSVVQNATVNVAAVNDAPIVVMPTSYAMNEDTTLSITQASLLDHAYDIDGNALTVTSVSVAAGQGTISGNSGGPWTFTPAANFNGVATLTFVTSDGVATVSQKAVVNVAPVADALSVPAVTLSGAEDTPMIICTADFVPATDVDGNALSVTNVTVPANQGTIYVNGNGNWVFTPAANFNGAASLTFTASNGASSASQIATVNIASVNDVPVVNAPTTALSMNEDGAPIQITQAYLLGNASDADGNAMLVTSVSVPASQGTITGVSGGPWTFTPKLDFNGVANLTYTVTDNIIATPVTQSAIINIASIADNAKFIINDQKTLDPNFYTAGSNLAVQYNATTTATVNSTDIQNASITETYSSANNVQLKVNSGEVQNAFAFDDSNATIKLTNFERSDVTLGDGGNSSVTLASSARGDINTGSGADTINITSIADANAPTEADTYTGYVIKDLDYGKYTINAGEGVNNITIGGTYSASDIKTGAGIDTINTNSGDDIIDAGAGNDIINTGAGWDTIYAGKGNDTVDGGSGVGVHATGDLYGDTIIFSGARNEYVVTLKSSSGTYTVTDLMPNRDGVDKYTHVEKFQFTDGIWYSSVIDSTGNDCGPYLETDVNNAPVVPPVTLSAIVEDTTTALSITKSQLLSGATKDIENQTMSILSVSVPAAQGTITGSGNGPWSFLPAANFNGTANITFVVSDNGTSSSAVTYTQVATINVTAVNDAPVAGGSPVSFTTLEDRAVLISQASLLSNTSDIDSTNLSIASISVNQGTIVSVGNGMYAYNPPANYTGGAVISFTVSDGSLTSATQTANVTITPVADTAIINSPAAFSMKEDGSLSITQASLLANTSNPDGSTLTVTSVAVPAAEGTITGNSGGPWTFVPTANFNGVAALSFTTYNGSSYITQSATVNIAAVNDAPVVALPTIYNATEDNSLSITQASLLGHAGDIDGNTLTVTSVTVAAAQGTISGNSGGPWTFTPAANFNGVATLTFVTSDGTATVAQNAIVNVAAVNDAPVINSLPTLSVAEDNTLVINQATLLAGVTDVDGNALSISNISVTNSAQGTIVNNGNGTWSFTPAANFNGTAGLTFTVSDGTTTVNQSINVAVSAVNDAPIVSTVNMSMSEDGSLSFTNAQLLASAGASDVEGSALSIASITSPVGSLSFNSANSTWTLNNLPANYNGQIALSFTVSDGSTTTAKALNITVNAINDAPVVSTASINMIENSAVLITAADLLSHATDVDSANLSITSITAAQGILTDNGNGTWTFAPAANFSGTVNLQYTVSDGLASTSQQLGVNVVHNANDLHFDINNQQAINPNYYSADNYEIGQPALFNHDYTVTATDGAHILSNFASTTNASVTMQSSSAAENIDASSQNAGTVTLHDFNRTDVHLGNDGNSTVNIYNADRGEVETGDGSDHINISTKTTADSLNNTFNINSDDSADVISITGNNDSSIFNIHTGAGDDTVSLQGKYASANIFGDIGNDIITAETGNNIYHFGGGQGHDTFNAGSGLGWADCIILDSTTSVSITQNDTYSWTLIVDGHSATLSTDVTGVINENRLDFAGSANGSLTLHDGSTLNFNNVEHVEW